MLKIFKNFENIAVETEKIESNNSDNEINENQTSLCILLF